ncbi:phage portal protein [Streptomyces sp. SID8111]|uniref:phage portal protein n=1 Tax=Streptomyces sp. SID8111 TaxID=2706100 RepID=UPI0013C00CC3|nr:phage portal protein [Streptomyces sp. SID8111]NEC29579.1 phage portal protein [Streptomyces sp. SID8111]
MALPESGSAWPPPQWAAYYRAMSVDDAWYSGDRHRLARIYGHHHDPRERRKLWGRILNRPRPSKREARLHVPLAGDIARTSADLLFADMPTITVDNTTAQDRLAVLLDEGRVHETLLQAAEQAAAISGVFLRVTWDRDLVQRPLLTVMQADNAIPEFRFGMLRAVTFWRELEGSTQAHVWRHMERHAPGVIEHALYEGTGDNLGRRVPLTEHPETRDIAATLDASGDSVSTGIPMLTAAYLPNMLPNRLHRTAPVGRSDYAAVHDLFDSLDEVWTSWMRDIRLARARLIVPEAYLNNEGPGRGASFDDDREVYHGLKIPPTDNSGGITLAQFKIRVEEHQRTSDAIVRQAIQTAGYDGAAFGIDEPGGQMTATEVDARSARGMRTRKKKVGYARHSVADAVHAMLALDAKLFTPGLTVERPRVEFGDGVAESPQQTATTLDLLSRAGAVSTATKVKWLHPEWNDTEVEAEVRAILLETGAGTAPDPGDTYPLAA